MYVFFVVQAVLAALHAAVAQAPFFQLACPGAGFIVGSHHIVKCTVRGQNVTGAGCVAPVSSVKLETVNSVVINTIGYSIYPTCETSWSHSGNDNGRCEAIDANNIYTYEFNVTADRAILTNSTGLRCYADCATGPGLPNPLTYNSSESCGPPVKFVEQSTTVPPSTSEIPPDDGVTCETGCIIGATVGTVVAALVTGGAAAMWAMTIKVDVGYPREQITRIKEYATKLNALLKPKDGKDLLKDSLEEKIQEKLNTSFRFDVSIDGNYAIQADGMPKTDKDHLHVLVQLSKIPNVTKFNDIYKAVTNFVAENVRKNHVRTVVVLKDTEIPDMASIANETIRIFPERCTSPGNTQRLLTICEKPEYEGAESAEKKLQTMKINPQNAIQIEGDQGAVDDAKKKKKKPQYVIQIEGDEGAAVDAAEKKVKDLLRKTDFDRTIAVSPHTPQIEDLARQYIEEMTGTTINQTDDCLRSILIQGSNEKYIKTAENKVFDFLHGKVRLVLVPKKTPVKKEALDKIEEETGTTVCYPLENGKERLVVHIEGPNKEKAAEAASKVEALFTPPSTCCLLWPFTSRTAASPSEIV